MLHLLPERALRGVARAPECGCRLLPGLLFAGLLVAGVAAADQVQANPRDDARQCAETVVQGGDMQLAVELCSRAIASRQIKNEDLAPIYYNRGWAQDELGNYDAAIEDYGRALHIRPDYADAYVARGYSYGRIGERDRAIEDYGRALEADPDNFEASFNRGLAYEAKGDLERAVADYDRAYALNPEHPRLRAIMKRLLRLKLQ